MALTEQYPKEVTEVTIVEASKLRLSKSWPLLSRTNEVTLRILKAHRLQGLDTKTLVILFQEASPQICVY